MEDPASYSSPASLLSLGDVFLYIYMLVRPVGVPYSALPQHSFIGRLADQNTLKQFGLILAKFGRFCAKVKSFRFHVQEVDKSLAM